MDESLRPIEPVGAMTLRGSLPNELAAAELTAPEVRIVDPTELLVDETYQRSLSEGSMRLIRRIVSHFSWSKFKPPIVSETKLGLEVIDGQHTAIAAATHPQVNKIPVLVVRGETVADRADSFLGHNRDRLNMVPTQIHYAALAARDKAAIEIDVVCKKAGIKILRLPPAQGKFKPKETLSVNAIGSLCVARGPQCAYRVLHVLAMANCTPIRQQQIKAAEEILYGDEYKGVDETSLANAIRELGEGAEREARIFAATHKLPIWRGLVILYYRKVRQRRRAA